MLSSNSEYDTGVNTFSPEGRIYQIEYSMNASKLGASGVGLVCPGGVVLAVEKKASSKLVEKLGFEKIAEVDSHIFAIVSGLIADSQRLTETARSEAHYHRFIYQEAIPVKATTQAVADIALNFGEGDRSSRKPISRPFGVSLLFGGVDRNGPSLYQMDPSGTVVGYLAKGVGSAEQGINSLLEKHYKEDMSLNDAETLALSVLKQVMEEKIKAELVDLAVLKIEDGKFVRRSVAEIEEILKSVKELL